MVARSPLRLLAPIAIAVVLVGVIVVIASSDGGSDDKQARPTTVPARTTPVRRFYVVRRGDTLTGIADRFRIPSQSLAALNPRVDPQALQPGTRLKLRP